ncbi:MAG: hypothetical protein ABF630_09800 [Liquorilactobacillus sp.]|uniref:hypothetical protein n=1 Tax=Liquorilactobacillus nagelii TaxID=82688 RepID=UPI0039EAAD89
MKLTIISRTPEEIWTDRVIKIAKCWKKTGKLSTNERQKLLLALYKSFDLEVYQKMSLRWRETAMFMFNDLIEGLTPRQFYQVIPIRKQFDGKKYEVRDYFTAREFIEKKIGWDNKIPNGFEFLMNYWDRKINLIAVWAMDVVNDSRQRKSGKSIFEEFARENGIHLMHMYELKGGGLSD